MSAARVILFVALIVVLYKETKGYCSDNSDCYPSGEVCCKPNDYNFQCYDDCIGKSCLSDSDCGGYDEYCCDETCKKGNCVLAAWIITIIVLSVLGVIATIVGVVLCVYCSYRRRSPGLIVATTPAVSVPTTTVVGGTATYSHGQFYPPMVQPQVPSYGPPPYTEPAPYAPK